MEFTRYFTKPYVHPFDDVNWVKRTSQIKDKNGNIIFKQEDVEFPDFWEPISIDITVEKYFAGILGSSKREYSLKQMINRIVNWYVNKGEKDGYFNSKEDLQCFKDELTYLLLHQYGSFNTPVYLNCGVQEPPQVSACFILSAEDNMISISENMQTEINIFRRGSGVGTNHSSLRSSKEIVSKGGYAMGPLHPMYISDKIAKAIKSDGKSRRAAIMKELNIDHGDIEDFITQKAEVEKAAKVLIKNGWSSEFDDPKGAYGLLGLQNFNESVSIPDSFMRCLEKDEDWALIERRPTDPSAFTNDKSELFETSQGIFREYNGNVFFINKKNNNLYKVIKWVKAKYLWDLICKSAWESADPGIQFYDTINSWNSCKNDGDINGSNPCSEYFFLDDTSCNLASLNLLKFLKEDTTFDIDGYVQAIRVFITAMDISVHNAFYPSKSIAEKTKQYRTLGLGYTNLGALLLRKLYPYDSDEGRYYASALMALLLSVSYRTSAEIGNKLGAFERFEKNKKSMYEILDKHRDAINKLYKDYLSDEINLFITKAKSYFPSNKNNFRNAHVTVVAPTGTISLMMGCETTGIEPMLGLVTYKKMVGGGYLKLTVPSVNIALKKLGYSYIDVLDISKIEWKNAYHKKIFQTSFGNDNILSPDAHIKMVASIQPFLSGSASKTVNVPSSATVEDISNIYKTAWILGLKCVSVYRDGCKGSQPLNLEKEESKKDKEKDIKKDKEKDIKKDKEKDIEKDVGISRRLLPVSGQGHRHRFHIDGQTGYIHLGFFENGDLGEVFIEISKGGSTLNGLMNTIAILISHMLQYGIPPKEIIDALKNLKFEPRGFTDNPNIKTSSSIPDYVAKYIEWFLFNKEKSKENLSDKEVNKNIVTISNAVISQGLYGPPCHACGHLTFKTGSCYLCSNCGETTGCG